MYNTFSRQKEEFKPLNPPAVTMYNCGPTVYDTFHIGNTRNFIVADVIRRYLIYKGYKVKFVQNITDIDDKIIKRANEEGVTSDEIARKYTEYFFKYTNELGIKPPDVSPRATEHIPQMIEFIKKLLDSGHAYQINGDIFFRIKSYEKYGQLSGKRIEDLLKGARVEVDERKENPLDFALWKSAKPGEPSWETPWGKGRPGWHIECSVMSMHHLGTTLDIHSGGIDLVFPHHENERAQSEALTGSQFVRYWIHNGFLNIDSRKMSKSLGNFLTIDQVLSRYNPGVVRFFLLSAHYRHPLDYTETNMNEARSAWQRIVDTIVTTDALLKILMQDFEISRSNSTQRSDEIIARIHSFKSEFETAMDDDFNTAEAQATLFKVVGEIHEIREILNVRIKNRETPDRGDIDALEAYRELLLELIETLGFKAPAETGVSSDLQQELIQILIDIRQLARTEKQFKIADTIRSRLAEQGIILEDYPQGTIWKMNR